MDADNALRPAAVGWLLLRLASHHRERSLPADPILRSHQVLMTTPKISLVDLMAGMQASGWL